MNMNPNHRGAAPVGHIDHLGDTEQLTVRLLRAWRDGSSSVAKFENRFCRIMGKDRSDTLLDAMAQICRICSEHGRRPLMCHGTHCSCLGADESCFANFVANAADGNRDDALLIATLLVRPDFAPCLVGYAESLGRYLNMYALRSKSADVMDTPPDRSLDNSPANRTLH